MPSWWQCLRVAPALFTGVALLFAAIVAARPPAAPDLRDPGLVLMLRHARAPGTGDPPGFDLADCSTQRNLDAEGRVQARRMGERLRAAGVAEARVYTSEWCRCRETATLLGFGEPAPLPALNSFFAAPREREARMEALAGFLAGLPVDGGLVVLVTHQVTITELTGVYPASGDGVILRLDATGRPPVVGRWRAPQPGDAGTEAAGSEQRVASRQDAALRSPSQKLSSQSFKTSGCPIVPFAPLCGRILSIELRCVWRGVSPNGSLRVPVGAP